MLAQVFYFGRNPRGSPDFLAYLVPKACMHVLGTWVTRCLAVGRSTSSPKAAQALGCCLIPGLWISHLHGAGCLSARAMDTGFPTVVWSLGLGLNFTTTPGWGSRCVCVGTGFGFAPPFRAGVCGVCGWARVLAGSPPLLAGFVCALRL